LHFANLAQLGGCRSLPRRTVARVGAIQSANRFEVALAAKCNWHWNLSEPRSFYFHDQEAALAMMKPRPCGVGPVS
jgi:hypothetical protein